MVKQKVAIGVFRHAESKSCLSFWLAPSRGFGFCPNSQRFFAGFPQNDKFLGTGKTRLSGFPEYPPLEVECLVFFILHRHMDQ